MIKSLITLVILVLAPLLTLLLFDGPYNPVTVVSTRLAESYHVSVFDNTFSLIDTEINNADPARRSDRMAEILGDFGSNLELKNLEETNLSDTDKKRVQEGKTVYSTHQDIGTLTRLVPGEDQVMVMYVDENEAQETYRLAKGPISLIEKHIQNYPQDQWPSIVAELNESFRIPLELMLQASYTPPKEITETFTNDNLSWYENENDGDKELFFLRLEDSDQGLLIGPLPTPLAAQTSLYIFFLTFIVFLISLCLLLWLWPLWRNLKAMKASALAFGNGHLTARVNVKKMSIVSDLAGSFNSMANSIQDLITANQHLTNAVAHDLRTPLARLRFALEILDSGDCTPEETQRYKQSIEASIDSLDYLVNQTLTHARYNRVADIRNFGDHNFAKTLHEEVSQTRFDHPELAIDLVVDPDLESDVQFVDKKALGRALANLLSNAVKHASTNVRVSYRKEPCPNLSQKGECLSLRVDDDGKGINEEDYQRILQPFAQLDNEERNASLGHGLGLAIVNQIAKWHKGQVKISRSPLGGASIELTWPIANAHQQIP